MQVLAGLPLEHKEKHSVAFVASLYISALHADPIWKKLENKSKQFKQIDNTTCSFVGATATATLLMRHLHLASMSFFSLREDKLPRLGISNRNPTLLAVLTSVFTEDPTETEILKFQSLHFFHDLELVFVHFESKSKTEGRYGPGPTASDVKETLTGAKKAPYSLETGGSVPRSLSLSLPRAFRS